MSSFDSHVDTQVFSPAEPEPSPTTTTTPCSRRLYAGSLKRVLDVSLVVAALPVVVRVGEGCGVRPPRRGRLADAIGDLGDLEHAADRCGDAVQLAGGVEGGDKGLEVGVGHWGGTGK